MTRLGFFGGCPARTFRRQSPAKYVPTIHGVESAVIPDRPPVSPAINAWRMDGTSGTTTMGRVASGASCALPLTSFAQDFRASLSAPAPAARLPHAPGLHSAVIASGGNGRVYLAVAKTAANMVRKAFW